MSLKRRSQKVNNENRIASFCNFDFGPEKFIRGIFWHTTEIQNYISNRLNDYRID